MRHADETDPEGERANNEGAHETVRPVAGETLEDTERYPVKRFRLVSVTVDVPESPRFSVIELGAEMLKSTTVTVTLVVWCDNPSLVPVTVTT
jgi:hypothetical protein